MNLVLISKGLSTMDLSQMTTSSQKFEYSFARNFSNYSSFNVLIISLGLEYGEVLYNESKQLKLVGISGNSMKETISNLKQYLRGVKSKKTIVLNYGYDLMDNLVLTILQRDLNFKRVAFIFDSHYGATENFSRFKYILSEFYFKTSILLSKRIDAFLLFNQQAVEELKITKPYYVTRPGLEPNNLVNKRYSRTNEKFTILYTGTLINYNGIIELLRGFSKIEDNNFQLRIFGAGPLENSVMKYSQKDKRIFYGGLVESGKLKEEYNNADLLINFRKTDHIVAKFSFPSKLIEYISMKKPVLSTNLNFNSEVKKGLFIIDELDSQLIKNKIKAIEAGSDEMKNKKIKIAYQHLIEDFNWQKVISEIESFFYDTFV
ncbi:glycosyltransferase [Aerococcus sp.]|uniref:glycosyltransferase n=1 Tax=Aerococcus sp. TaxID=1872398 RepID=UPI0028AFE5F9|nr:glycosyltransferase [Aerococcus sp.]